MSTYTGKASSVNKPQAAAYANLADISTIQGMIDKAPQEVRDKIGDVRFTEDEIIIGTPQMGDVTLKVVERVEPSLIRYEALGSPVPLSMTIEVKAEGEEASTVTPAISVDLPAMLRPFIGPKLQEATDKLGDFLAFIARV